jgi:rRNA maturation protein Rpf1
MMTITALKHALEFVEFCWRDVSLNDYAEEFRQAVEDQLEEAIKKAERTQKEHDQIAELLVEASHVLSKLRWEQYAIRDFLPDELDGAAIMLRGIDNECSY